MKTVHITTSSTVELDEPADGIAITVEPGIEVTIVETGHHETIELVVGENAIVNYLMVFSGQGQSTKRAQLQANAACHWRTALLGGTTQQEIYTEHIGDGSTSDHHGIFLGKDRDRFAMNYWSEHTAKHTAGTIRIHGVLFDRAYADFKGNIKIAQTGTDTDASLTEQTLLIGQQARSDSVPQLEIDTNDVRAAHSSAITQIDDEQLFYLQTRGISVIDGKRMIVRGFLDSIVDEFPDKKIREQVLTFVEQRLIDI